MDQKTMIRMKRKATSNYFFLYKDTKYPFNKEYFMQSSKYIIDQEEELEKKKCIPLLTLEEEKEINLSPETINNFIKYVEREAIPVNNYNVIELNFLSQKYNIEELIEDTDNYISLHQSELVLPLLINSQESKIKYLSKYEKIISLHLLDYINDDRIFSLNISILYRIIENYIENSIEKMNFDLFFDFLFKCIDKYGRCASILFSFVDLNEMQNKHLNTLITKYSNVFDFNFINSAMLKSIYEIQNDFLKKMEEHKIYEDENKKEISLLKELQEKYKNDQQEVNKKYEDEINKLKEEIRQLKEELSIEKRKNSADLEEAQRIFKEEISRLQYRIDEFDKIQKQKESGIPLLLNEKGEFNGIVKYLTDKTGGNIFDNGTIDIQSNGYYNESFHPKFVLEYNDKHFYEPKSSSVFGWFYFDFKKMKIKITNYSIKTRPSGKNGHHPKSWDIEVSNDANSWIKIDEQKDCQTLNESSITATFSVKQNEYSRYVRFYQKSEPWGGGYLDFNMIEFYGYLQEQ